MVLIRKLGIIAPRTFTTGGFDISDNVRIRIRKFSERIVTGILASGLSQDPNFTLVGITGLGLGPEQDFADICRDHNVDYSGYLSFENQNERWNKLPVDITNKYFEYLEKAVGIHQTAEGQYSPRKTLRHNNKVVEDSDFVIIINTTIKQFTPEPDCFKHYFILNI